MARARTHLRPVEVHQDTGEVVPQAWELDHAVAVQEVIALLEDKKALGHVVAKLQQRIEAMERDKEAEREAAPNRALIEEVHAWWKQRCRHPNAKLRADRFDAWESLLRDYTREQVMWMVVGLGEYPWEAYGERYAEKAQGRTRRDEPEYLAARSPRQEKAGRLGYLWMRDRGEALPEAHGLAALTLISKGVAL